MPGKINEAEIRCCGSCVEQGAKAKAGSEFVLNVSSSMAATVAVAVDGCRPLWPSTMESEGAGCDNAEGAGDRTGFLKLPAMALGPGLPGRSSDADFCKVEATFAASMTILEGDGGKFGSGLAS